jgi:aspartate aminotransferase-like enzyme
MPYTHNWQAMAALRIGLQRLFDEGLEQVYARHRRVMEACHRRLEQMGVGLLPPERAFCSPTVTAANVPNGWNFAQLDQALRRHGMAVGGSYGPLAGKVFRIGHMGSQADLALLERGMDVLEQVLR